MAKFMNGKDFADHVAAGTNSVKTEASLKRCLAAMSPVGEKRKYYTPKVAVPGYHYNKDSFYDQEIVVDINGYGIVLVSNRKGTLPQEVRIDKTTEGCITGATFEVAVQHFKGVNNLVSGHYRFVDAATKTAYSSSKQFFNEVIKPKNREAIAAYKAAIKALGKVKA